MSALDHIDNTPTDTGQFVRVPHDLEMPKDRKLSGRAYVVAKLRLSDEEGLVRIPTSEPNRCDHTARICARCAPSWSIDYQLLLDRTAAGRAIKARVGQEDPAATADTANHLRDW